MFMKRKLKIKGIFCVEPAILAYNLTNANILLFKQINIALEIDEVIRARC